MRRTKKRPWRRKKPRGVGGGSTPSSSTRPSPATSPTFVTTTPRKIDLCRSVRVRVYVHRDKQQKVIMSKDLFSEDEHLEMEQNASIVVRIEKIDDMNKKSQGPTFLARNYRDIEWIERGSRLRGLPHDAKISLRSDIASKLSWRAESLVNVCLADIKSMGLHFVEVSLKSATSADVWGIHRSLRGKCLYNREDLKRKMDIHVNSLLRNRSYVFSGVFRATTKLITRSLACDLTWLIQVSTEMFEFGDDGDFYWEKMIDQFIRDLLHKWNELRVRHSLTVVLFARIKMTSSTSKKHRDFYDIPLRDVCVDSWETLLPSIRISFHRFYSRVRKLCISKKAKLTCAAEGNLLEAVNLTLNRYDMSNVNVGLTLLGRSIVIMTASSGSFEVGRDLSAITELRMKRTGMGCDLVCMAEPPLHASPLFVLRENKMYDVPHWAHISFFRSYVSSKVYDQIVGMENSSISLSPKSIDDGRSSNSSSSRGDETNSIMMSAVSIFGSSKGGLHREKYSKLSLAARLGRVLWPVPISRRDLPISRRIKNRSSKGKIITSSSSLKGRRQSPIIKMSRKANSFPSPPVRLSSSLDDHSSSLLSHGGDNDTKSKSATLNLPSNKTLFKLRRRRTPSSSSISIPEAKLHDESLFASSSSSSNTSEIAQKDRARSGGSEITSNLSLVLTSSRSLPDNDDEDKARKATSMANLGLNISVKRPSAISTSYKKRNNSVMSQHLVVRGTRISKGKKDQRLGSFRNLQGLRDTFTKELARSTNLKANVYGKEFNPFRHRDDAMQRITSRRQRWSHLYPGMLLATNVNVAKWKSLCEPAILPLTTMHFPSPRELVRDFEVNTYPLKIEDSEYDDLSCLLDELVRQRLSNAFQLAVREGEDETGHRLDTMNDEDDEPTKTSSSSPILKTSNRRREYLLHSGRTAHQLVYDVLENEIRVTEYVLKRKLAAPLVKYTYEKFCQNRRKWTREQATFRLQDALHWKTIDEVVSGEEWDATQEAVSVKSQKRAEQSYVVTTDNNNSNFLSKFEINVLHRSSPAKLLPQMRSNRSRRKVKVSLRMNDDDNNNNNSTTRRQWIFVDIRDIGTHTKVFTLQWLSASHSRVHSFVNSMYVDAKALGLTLWKIPTSWKGIDPSPSDPFLSLPIFPWPPKAASMIGGNELNSYLSFKLECVSRFRLRLLYKSKSRENCETYLAPNGLFLLYFTPTKIMWHTNSYVATSSKAEKTLVKLFTKFSSFYSIYSGARSLVYGIVDHAVRSVRHHK